MVRTFQTHKIRKTEEISRKLWDFGTLPKEGPAVTLKAALPGCWETYPDTMTYRGRAYYETDFEAGGNIRLEFKGVSHTAEVFVDGSRVKSHYNAYTPFDVILTGLETGKHRLRVEVDNSFGEESALHVPNDYQTYGGITRPVVLEQLGDAMISRLHFTPVLEEGTWKGTVSADILCPGAGEFRGTLEIYLGQTKLLERKVEFSREEQALSQEEVEFSRKGSFTVTEEGLSFPEAESWSPENPVLYLLTAVLKDEKGEPVDDLTDRIGFRQVRIEGRKILLNGSPIRIKGFCRHEDHPQFGCALPYAAMYQDLLLMRDMGANSVRTSHYPNDEVFLDLCDELGMLVWEENHARGLSEENMRNPNFERQCEDCIREMITAHYNHPSIYIWGILNECASHTEYGRECYRKQLELIRSLDGSRPHSFASCQFKTDISLGLPDVVSYNIYPQWYHDTPVGEYLEDLYQWVQETEGAGKPFLITETGAGAIYGYRTPARVKWSEEYQAEALEKQLTAILAKEECSGVYIWQFCDCRVCDSWFHVRPRTMNNKGIVDEYRRPKLAYETVKRIFRG